MIGILLKRFSFFLFFILLTVGLSVHASLVDFTINDDFTVVPAEIFQGAGDVTITVVTEGAMAMPDKPSGSEIGGPYFTVEGLRIDGDVICVNPYTLTATFKVDEKQAIGDRTVTVLAGTHSSGQDGIHTSDIAVLKATEVSKLKIVPPPKIFGCHPAETYRQNPKDIEVYGRGFEDKGSSATFFINGIKVSTGKATNSTEFTFSSDLTKVTPSEVGNPHPISILDTSDVEIFADNDLFILHSTPTIHSVNSSLFRGQQSATVDIHGIGFEPTSQVFITTSTDYSFKDSNIKVDAISPATNFIGIRATISVNKSVDLDPSGDRFLWVVNPDVISGHINRSSFPIENFVKEAYIPEVDKQTSTTTVTQGDSVVIYLYITSNTITWFEVGSTIEIPGEGLDPISIAAAADATHMIDGNNDLVNKLAVYLNVSEDAQVGTRVLSVKNPTYGTDASYELTISSSRRVNLGTAELTVDGDFYVGEASTVTITCPTTAAFEEDATVMISNISEEDIITTFISSRTLWCYVSVPTDMMLGQQTITVTNEVSENLSVSKTKFIIIEESPYVTFQIEEVDFSSNTATFYQGKRTTATIICSGNIEEEAVVSFSPGISLVAGSVVKLHELKFMITFSTEVGGIDNDASYEITTDSFILKQVGKNDVEISRNQSLEDIVTAINIEHGWSASIEFGEEVDGRYLFRQAAVDVKNSTDTYISSALWFLMDVAKIDNLGEQYLTINNSSYIDASFSVPVIVAVSEASNPTITSIAYSSTTTDSSVILYKGETREIFIKGIGFQSNSVFSTLNANIIINTETTQVLSSTEALLSITVGNIEDLEDTTYSLTVTNEEFDASFTLQGAIEINTKHVVLDVFPTMLSPGTTEYFKINGTDFNLDNEFYILIDGQEVFTDTTIINADDYIVFITSECNSRVQVSCEVQVGRGVPNGMHDVSLYFVDNQSTATKNGAFKVPLRPEITSIPTTVSQGEMNKEVTILGKNFEAGATVTVGGSGVTPSSFSVTSTNLMTFLCDLTSDAEKTDRQVAVINRSGQFSTGTLKVIAPPIIKEDGVNPSSVMKGTTRYLEITGQNFNKDFDIIFSGTTTYQSEGDTSIEESIHIISVNYTGGTHLSAEVYIGKSVLSGAHDIEVINYEDDSKQNKQSQGIGSGVLKVRTPLSISNDIVTIPAGYEGKFIILTGEGFDKEMEIEFSGALTDIEIPLGKFINSQEYELTLDVDSEANLGERTITLRLGDDSASKKIIEIIQPLAIKEITPENIPIGLRFASMHINAEALDLDITTTTVIFNKGLVDQFPVTGIDPDGQVEIIGGGIENLVIDSDTYNSGFMTLYFSVYSTATAGSRDLLITNQDQENIIEEKSGVTIIEGVEISVFTPSQYQPTSEFTPFKILGSGFDSQYKVGSSTITFTNNDDINFSITHDDDDEIQGTFTWAGSTDTILSNRFIDITVENADGTIGKLEDALYLLEELKIIQELTTPTTIPINAKNYSMTIKGKGFIDGIDVSFDIAGNEELVTINEIEFVDSSEIIINFDTDSSIVPGSSGAIILENPNGSKEDPPLDDFIMFQNLPTIYSIDPGFVRVGGEKDVTITGINFDLIHSTGITISNGLSLLITSPITPTEIQGTIIASQSSYAGDVSIYLSTVAVDNIQSISEGLFEVLPEPTVDEVHPSTLYANKMVQFHIYGEGFDSDIELIIRDIKSGVTTYATLYSSTGDFRRSDTRIIAEELTISQEGTYNIELVNQDGSKIVVSEGLTVYSQVTEANISTVEPQFAVLGEEEKELTIFGANFLDGVKIGFEGGISVTTSNVSYSSATIVINVPNGVIPGVHNLIFSNPNSTPATKTFYVIAQPVVTGITPSTIQQDTTVEVTIVGEKFVKDGGAEGGNINFSITGDDITVLDTDATFVASGHIFGRIYVGKNANVGPHDVIVNNPFSTYGSGGNLLIIEAPVAITTVSPNITSQGEMEADIIVSGTGFEPNLNVDITGMGVSVENIKYVSSEQLVLTIKVVDGAKISNRGIKITNPDKPPVTIPNKLQVLPKVIIERLSPSRIARGISSLEMNIIGSNFHSSSNYITLDEFSFGNGFTISNIVTHSQEHITFDLSVEADAFLSTLELNLETGDGLTVDKSNALEIIDAIDIDNIEPSQITLSSYGVTTATLTMNGIGFISESSMPTIVFSDSISVASRTFESPSILKAYISIPLGSTLGKKDVTITNEDNTFGEGIGLIELTEALKISTASPYSVAKGVINAGITLTGEGFSSNIEVEANDSDVTITHEYISREELMLYVTISTAHVASTAVITVTNPDTSIDTFTLDCLDLPAVTSISPDNVGQGAKTSIILTGFHLEDVTEPGKIVFTNNDINVLAITASSDNSLTLDISVSEAAIPGLLNTYITDSHTLTGISYNVFEIIPSPAVNIISPTTLTPGTTQVVTFIGSGFKDGVTVSFPTVSEDKIFISSYTYTNLQTFSCQIYAVEKILPGLYHMKVTNTDGSMEDVDKEYTILEVPKTPIISYIVPEKLAFGAVNQDIYIYGSNFLDNTLIDFGADEITISTQTILSTQINLQVNVSDSDSSIDGYSSIKITNPIGNKSTTTFTMLELVSVPNIQLMIPSTLTQGTTIEMVELTGSGFIDDGLEITVSNNTGISISNIKVVGRSKITFDVYTTTASVLNNHDITILTANGETQGVGIFDIVPPLSITSADSDQVAAGSQNRDVWIYGTGFDESITRDDIVFGDGGIGIDRLYFIKDTTLRLVLDVDATAVLGDRKITISKDNGDVTSQTGVFEVIPPVTVISITPKEASIGIKDLPITIEGTEFSEGLDISFTNGSGVEATTITVVSESKITAFLTIEDDAEEGSRNLVITNSNGNFGFKEAAFIVEETVKVQSVINADGGAQYFTLDGSTTQVLSIGGKGFKVSSEGIEPEVIFSGLEVLEATNTFVSSSKITSEITLDMTSVNAGDYIDVRVRNYDGTTGIGKSIYYFVDEMLITKVIPDEVPKGAELETITILGEGFVEGLSLEFNELTNTSDLTFDNDDLKVIDDRTIEVDINVDVEMSTGYVTFTVLNPGQGDDYEGIDSTNTLTIIDAPVIHYVYPEKFQQGADNQVMTVIGTSFTNFESIDIAGGIQINSSQIYTSSITVNMSIDGGAGLGSRSVSITAGGNTGQGRDVFEVTTAPVIKEVFPTYLTQGTEDRTVEIRGEGFDSTSDVRICDEDEENALGITILNTSIEGDGKITLTVDISSTTSVIGFYDIKVDNSNGSSGEGLGVIEIVEPPIEPFLQSITPKRLRQGEVDQQVVVQGYNLQNGVRAVFGGGNVHVTSRTYSLDNSQVVLTVTVDDEASLDWRTLTLTNPDNGSASYEDVFEVFTDPSINEEDGIEPSNAILKSTTSTKTVELIINGTALKRETVLEFSHSEISLTTVTYISNSQLKAVLAISSAVSSGLHDIKVINPYGATGFSPRALYISDPIVISSITPNQISSSLEHQELKIWGEGFVGGMDLQFLGSGIQVHDLEYRNENLVVANVTIGVGAEETFRKATLTNPYKITSEDTGVDKLEVLPKPVVKSIHTPEIEQDSETLIHIKGAGFYGSKTQVPSVEFSGNGIEVTSVIYNGSTDLTAYIIIYATATTGERDVTVTFKDASSMEAIGKGVFMVKEILDVVSLSITKIPQGDEERSISVVGTGFEEGIEAQFLKDGVTVVNTRYKSKNELELIVTVGTSADLAIRDLLLTNPETLDKIFEDMLEVVYPISLDSIEPNEIGLGVSEKQVILRGTNFEDQSIVTIKGTGLKYSTVSYNSTTEIILKVEVNEGAVLSKRDITVEAPSGNRGEELEFIEVVNAISVSEVTPRYLIRGTEGSMITLRGSNFEYSPSPSSSPSTATPSTATITGYGVEITSITADSSTELKLFVTVASTATLGSRDLVVKNSDGSVGRSEGVLQVTEELSFSRMEPNNLGLGAESELISVYGTGFISDTNVRFGNPGITVRNIEYVTSEHLKVTISISDETSIGTSSVILENAIMSYSTTNADVFNITSSPVIFSAKNSDGDNKIRQGAKEQEIIISGGNIVESTNTVVSISGLGFQIIDTKVTGVNSIRITVNFDKTAAIGSRDITVTNPLSGEVYPYGIGKSVLEVIPGPEINSISPNFAALSAEDKLITVTGTGFSSGISLAIINAPGVTVAEPIDFKNAQLLQFLVSVSSNAVLGSYYVEVYNLDGSTGTYPEKFVIQSPPVVSAVGTPILVRGGESVRVDVFGQYFEDGATVYIEGMENIETQFISTNKLIVTGNVSIAAKEGPTDVEVINPNGSTGIGENLIEVIVSEPILGLVIASSTKIDYEKDILGTTVVSSVTISYELSQTVESLEIHILKTTNSLTSEPQVVRRWIYSNLAAGTHTLVWDGSVNHLRSDTGVNAYRKENNQYLYKVIATNDQGETKEVYGSEEIVVDVVHISDHYVGYTLIGDEQAKVAPYMLRYTLSKEAYANIIIKNSSGTVVRQYLRTLASIGENVKIWDGRDSQGVRVPNGIYKALVEAYDDSDPVDTAYSKVISISVDQLKIVDFQVASISSLDDMTKITFTPTETMRIDLVFYKPGTAIMDNGDGTVIPNSSGREVKTFNLFVEKGTTIEIIWDGTNARGDMLVDGLYPLSLVAYDNNGSYMTTPIVKDVSISRGKDFDSRLRMFEENFYAYPNPVEYNKSRAIKVNYGINVATALHLYVYDIMGNKVWEKNLGIVEIGGDNTYIDWALVNKSGGTVGRGIYILYLEGTEISTSKKLKATNKVMVIK
ncbi:MAG: hypothetical protein GY817_03175 [bacterium]|nr:hypothetical protein [bacterium]